MLTNLSEKINELLKDQLMVFDALSHHFKNVYWVDLGKKTARILKLDAAYVDVPNKEDHNEFPFDAVIDKWVDTIVHPEDREKVRKSITIENIKKVFETQEEFVGNYRSLVNGQIHHYQYIFNKADKSGNIAIAGFQIIDDIIEERQKIEQEKREKEIAHQKKLMSNLQSSLLYLRVLRMCLSPI